MKKVENTLLYALETHILKTKLHLKPIQSQLHRELETLVIDANRKFSKRIGVVILLHKLTGTKS